MNSSTSERLARFQALKNKREEATAANLTKAKEEDVEVRTNPRTQARLERKKVKAEAYLAKEAAESSGVDLERQNNLTYNIEDTKRWKEKLEAKAQRKDPGFTDYAQMTRRKYERLTEKLDPTAITKRSKEEARTAMADEIKEEQKQRMSYSKRRTFDNTEDVTYINERNAKFNRKVARAYDEYTLDLKDSIERGTAS